MQSAGYIRVTNGNEVSFDAPALLHTLLSHSLVFLLALHFFLPSICVITLCECGLRVCRSGSRLCAM